MNDSINMEIRSLLFQIGVDVKKISENDMNEFTRLNQIIESSAHDVSKLGINLGQMRRITDWVSSYSPTMTMPTLHSLHNHQSIPLQNQQPYNSNNIDTILSSTSNTTSNYNGSNNNGLNMKNSFGSSLENENNDNNGNSISSYHNMLNNGYNNISVIGGGGVGGSSNNDGTSLLSSMIMTDYVEDNDLPKYNSLQEFDHAYSASLSIDDREQEEISQIHHNIIQQQSKQNNSNFEYI